MFTRRFASYKSIKQVSQLTRQLSSLRISPEIEDALQTHKPVVALESTIITHGLPYPQNISMAQEVEKVIRSKGAVPATIAFVKGKPCVGLNNQEIELLAENTDNANKVSRRDIAYTMAHKLNGGTTISGTMILAEKAGIKVFATGGLGGAHKGSELTFDVSADLTELGRTKVAVVCAGPKSILDVAKTIEILETQGCFVSTYGKPGTNIPGFFAVDSGVKSPYNFQDFKSAAEVIHNGINTFGLQSGYLFCIPPPENVALDSTYINGIISEAEAEAARCGIQGKKLTPFLLGKIASITKGSSVDTNLQVVFNNAAAASNIAVELSKLENPESTFQPLTKINKQKYSPGRQAVEKETKADIAVVGSVAVDLICKLKPEKYHLGDSNPGNSSTSIGGVAYNVFLAAKYAASNKNITCKLVSQVGKDDFGKVILDELEEDHIDTTGIIINSSQSTAKYISVHDKTGALIVACADMDIAENFDQEQLVKKLTETSADIVLMDGNMNVESYEKIIKKSMVSGAKVIFEPTSSVKANKIAKVIAKSPSSFIFNNVHLGKSESDFNGLILATPTVAELRTIHDQLEADEQFDVDHWFPVLDAIGINTDFRNKLDNLSKYNAMKEVLKKGVLQQAFKILPYIPCLIVKLGKDGVLVMNLTLQADTIKDEYTQDSSLEDYFNKKPLFTITSKGKILDGLNRLGVVVQYYQVPKPIAENDIKNVTGAGDSFVGCLTHELADKGSHWLFEVGQQRNRAINKAQIAAGFSLQSEKAISDEIQNL